MSARDSLVTFRGVVYPAQCDAMGHMNVQHYVAAFDQAMWHLVAHLGYRPSWVTSRREGWADVRYDIRFRTELRPGELIHAVSSVRKVGKSSLQSRHVLIRTESGEVTAEVDMTSVYFDLEHRVSCALPDDIRRAADAALSQMVESSAPCDS
jgi:acyl-CoA thioester hydrolase